LFAGGRSGADGCGRVGAIFVELRVRRVGVLQRLHQLFGLGMLGDLVVGDLVPVRLDSISANTPCTSR
jgi:hypothetical protein